MKKASSGSNFGNDADFGNVVPYFSFKLCICQDPKIARAYTAQNKKKKKRTCRLSRSASIRVHVEVRNGYGRARGVGAAPRRRRCWFMLAQKSDV